MKIKSFIYIFLISIITVSVGCEKDNYEAPKSVLSGKVAFEGQSIGVRTNAVQLELWQHGYAFFAKIPVYVAQDGSYSALLFDGDYKLTRIRNSGPWVNNTDSIDVQVRGNTVVDVPVTPYTFVRSATYQRTGTTITGTAGLQTVSTANPLEFVALYVFRTALVDNVNQSAVAVLPAASVTNPNAVVMNVTVPASLAGLDAVYVRVGVKTSGVNELAFSPAQKVQLK